MAQEKTAKITSLVISAVVVIVYILAETISNIGMYSGAPCINRVLYHFVHASFLHAALNAWCLLSVVFLYDVSAKTLIVAFVIASFFPVNTLSEVLPNSECLYMPTVGLSGVCYALMGYIAFMVKRKLYYHTWLSIYIGVGFLFPNVNGWLHLYCYIVGLIVGYLNVPLRCLKR